MRELITTSAWWGAAGTRAARTALAALAGALGILIGGDLNAVILGGSIIALAVISSLATSLAGLPELTDIAVPWWKAALQRAARTFGQMLAAAVASAAVLSDITWAVVTQALVAAAVTLLLAVAETLPEVAPED